MVVVPHQLDGGKITFLKSPTFDLLCVGFCGQ